MTTVLDKIFAELNRPARKTVVVRKPAKPKKSPAQVVHDLQKNLDGLTASMGAKRIVIPLTKSAAKPQKRVRIIKLDPITKRDMNAGDPLASEGLGTLSARATGNVLKAEHSIDLDQYGGFTSRGKMTGEY